MTRSRACDCVGSPFVTMAPTTDRRSNGEKKRLLILFLLAVCGTYYTITNSVSTSPTTIHAFGPDSFTMGTDSGQHVGDKLPLRTNHTDSLEEIRQTLRGFLDGVELHLGSSTIDFSTSGSTTDVQSSPNINSDIGVDHQLLRGNPAVASSSSSSNLTPLPPPSKPPETSPAPHAPNSNSIQWCQDMNNLHHVKPGVSWGTLTYPDQTQWARLSCDQVVTHTEPLKESKASLSSVAVVKETGNVVDEEATWCREAMWKFDVRPGSTWGKLPPSGQAKWRTQNCDEKITNKAAFIDSAKFPQCDHQQNKKLPLVAVCCGTTTRKVTGPTLSKLALFRYLLPSMAHTVECGYRYVVVVGYDKGDPFYDSLHGQLLVEQWFKEHMSEPMSRQGVELHLQLVKVNNVLKKPGPVFNVITKHAYENGADFIYRVNDDSEMASKHWASKMIHQLSQLNPPFVGAVGPLCKQGNTKILTHDFTSRIHVEIFEGFYYPKELVDWWMDDWISRVYGSQRTLQGASVTVVHHTQAHGQRYVVDKSNKRHLEGLLKDGKNRIIKYMESHGADAAAIASMRKDRFNGHPFKQF